MDFQDSIELSDFALTPEGFLVQKARIARAGIQSYRAGEPGIREHFGHRPPTDIIQVYRPPEEVFHADSLASIAGKTVTIGHPGEFVNSENVGDLAVGFIGETVHQDGEYVAGLIRITHAKGVCVVQDGTVELSVGYDLDLDVTSGITSDGQPYEAIQRNIRANHVAIVDRGRCGAACRVHDSGQMADDICKCQGANMGTQIVDCGGNSVEVSDAAAIALRTLESSHTLAIGLKDGEIGGLTQKVADLEAELAEAKAKHEDAAAKLADAETKLTPEALDASAQARVLIITDAATLAPDLDVSKLVDGDIKRAVLKAIDVDVEGRSDEFVDAAFETRVTLVRDAAPANESTKTAAQLVAAANHNNTDPRQTARDAYLARMSVAYKGGN